MVLVENETQVYRTCGVRLNGPSYDDGNGNECFDLDAFPDVNNGVTACICEEDNCNSF